MRFDDAKQFGKFKLGDGRIEVCTGLDIGGDSLNAAMAALEPGASTLGSAVRMLWAGRDYLPGQAPQ